MSLKNTSNNLVGVIGAGGFGTAVANLLAQNADVLLYVRKKEVADSIERTRVAAGQILASNVIPTTILEDITKYCKVIFPIIPSQGFRELLQQLSPLLHSHHTLIHGIKGLDVTWPHHADKHNLDTLPELSRDQVKTMSELISVETKVTQVGCIAGPNLATELAQGQLAAVVVASASKMVMETGQKLLRSDSFQVYTNNDMLGVELCGVLKNIIAIGAGCLSGLGYGENAKAFLISRGLVEMIHIGKAMGATVQPFLGLAGIGDLIATCSTKLSRNYTVGYRLAQGETLSQILNNNALTAEGVYTVKVIRSLIPYYKMRAPITEMMYRILFEGLSVQEAINYLMRYPFNVDVDFI
jgi:glycerol-3-phosphate dehydrogenase (NAD(P)+)